MKQLFDFEEIRPFHDEEVPGVIKSLLTEEGFRHAVDFVLPGIDYEEFSRQMASFSNKRDFQTKLVSPFVHELGKKSTTSLTLGGVKNLSPSGSYTYISNHRDIILDASFLNILLLDAGFDTSEVAIGDNLLIYPWISNLVRLNKSFIVNRDVTGRKMLDISRRLSAYIHFVIKVKHQSIWIAQREGRAKNSDDKTQESVIKMLNLGGANEDVCANIRSLNIVPVSISYEYDPCDYLKAKEFQLKRDNPEYKKTPHDDLLNMETGLLGFKGRVHFQLTGCINDQLDCICSCQDKIEEINLIAQTIDNNIHCNYQIFPVNYIAYDLQTGQNRFVENYTSREKEEFLHYLKKQIGKIQLPAKDEEFLNGKMLEMYANPLKNKLKANCKTA